MPFHIGFLHSCAALDNITIDIRSASCGASAIAEPPVQSYFRVSYVHSKKDPWCMPFLARSLAG